LHAHSIGYYEVGSSTLVLFNTTNTAETVTSSNVATANMEISLKGTGLGLTKADFIPTLNPAGVAGKPINLALSNPPAANGGPVTVTVSGLPSDAQLNEGTNLGNGSWSAQTNDLTSLTVLTAFVGAMVLSVTETWANADGSTGIATVADNVEAYAPHSPIFALANDDTLTGAGGNDLFVFAQPIGNDTIHNFNVASDQIDLMGFANVASFSDLQIADDANGNAVVTVGPGETVTLQGVDASTLTASNFQFDQTPTLDNSGKLTISDGAILPLSGIVNNTGVIELNSTGDLTEIVIIGNGAALEGHGQVIMSDSSENFIVGTNANAILTNVDNTISGAGQIGIGDGHLTLANEVDGTINANISGGVLTLDTGNTITNYGLLEASNGGTLHVQDAVTGGSAVIAGGTMEFDAASSVAVTFDNGAGGTSYGVLVLIDPSHFTGNVSGFVGTAADLAHSDGIDVVGVNFNSGQFSDAYDSSTGVLTLSDGTTTDTLQFVGFKGDVNNFHFAEDANGTGTLVTDPPGLAKSATVSILSSETTNSENAAQSSNLATADSQQSVADGGQNGSVAIGGPGGDHFVFASSIGAETLSNGNAQQDTIELDQSAHAQTIQELQSLITTDAHGDALINLGHHDSVTPIGTTTPELQQLIQAGHVLLH
jgi:hypothetical protein